jgi:hypothetical protein
MGGSGTISRLVAYSPEGITGVGGACVVVGIGVVSATLGAGEDVEGVAIVGLVEGTLVDGGTVVLDSAVGGATPGGVAGGVVLQPVAKRITRNAAPGMNPFLIVLLCFPFGNAMARWIAKLNDARAVHIAKKAKVPMWQAL